MVSDPVNSAEGPEARHRLECEIGDEIELKIGGIECRAILRKMAVEEIPEYIEIPQRPPLVEERVLRVVGYNFTLELVSNGVVTHVRVADGI